MWLQKLVSGFVLLVFSSALALHSESAPPTTTDLIDNSIKSLEIVEVELSSLNANIVNLKQVIANLEKDSTASKEELQKQRDLLTQYQDRVLQLSKRYEELLRICNSLRQSLQESQTINAVAIPIGAVLLATVLLEGILLLKK